MHWHTDVEVAVANDNDLDEMVMMNWLGEVRHRNPDDCWLSHQQGRSVGEGEGEQWIHPPAVKERQTWPARAAGERERLVGCTEKEKQIHHDLSLGRQVVLCSDLLH